MTDGKPTAASCPCCGAALVRVGEGLCAQCVLRDALSHLREADGVSSAGLALDDIPRPGETHGHIGRYVLEEPIGSGGMGVVYRAHDPELKRTVAVKTLPGGRHARPDFKTRFRQEAESAARLDHPNIVRVHDFGEHDGLPYLVMEHVAGRTLAEMTGELLGSPRETATILKTLAEAVDHAHRRGVLHRDLKPANVLMGLDGRPRITDFGLARPLAENGGITQTGQLLGSPGYLAPEQLGSAAEEPDARTDVYGLGAVLYHLLTGRPPFVAPSMGKLLRQVQETDPVPPREINRLTPSALNAICLKCLAKDPTDRYATAAELAGDLRSFLDDRPVKARGLPLWRQVVRAVRRQPGWAAAVALLGVLTLLAASANHHLTGRANESAKQRGMEDGARAQTDAWRDYGVQIQAASDALAAEDPDQADAVLEQTPEAFRGWEHDWLKWRATQHHAIWASPDGQHGGLASVDLSPDGGLVASGGGNGWLWLNRMDSGEILGSTNLLGRKGINSVRFSPDNQRIITASQDGTAVIVATEGLRVMHRLTGHDAPVNAACFLDDGGRCVTAGADGSVRLWDAGSGEEMIQAVPGHPPEAIHDLAPSPDGTRLAAAGHAGSLWILSATNATLLQSWSGHSGPARAVAWSPDGARLASAGSTGDVYLWEVSTRERLRALSRGSGPTYRLAWSSDGQWLAGACNEGRVLVWNVENGEQAKPLTGHDGKVSGVVFTGNSGRLISSGFDSTLRVWTLRSTAGHFQQPTEGEQRTTAIVVGNNGRLLVRGDVSGRISVHELPGMKAGNSFAAHEKNVSALALSSEAQWLASASLDGTLRLWKGLRGELAAELLRGEEVVRDVCFSPDGRLLAAAGDNGTATLWNVAEAQLLRRLEPPEPSRIRVGEVLFSSDGRLLIAREARGRVGLWDVDTGSWRGFLGDPSQDGKATALALGTGTTVLVGYGHGTVTIWQVETMTRLVSFRAHVGAVTSLICTRDGARWFSGGADGELRVWQGEESIQLLRTPADVPVVRDLILTPEGKTLVSLGDNGTVGLWGAGL